MLLLLVVLGDKLGFVETFLFLHRFLFFSFLLLFHISTEWHCIK